MEKTSRKRKHRRNGCFAYGVTAFRKGTEKRYDLATPRHGFRVHLSNIDLDLLLPLQALLEEWKCDSPVC
jgi:hypothetical protein